MKVENDVDVDQDPFAALTTAQRGRRNHSPTSLSRGEPRRKRYGQLQVMVLVFDDCTWYYDYDYDQLLSQCK